MEQFLSYHKKEWKGTKILWDYCAITAERLILSLTQKKNQEDLY
ncbi:hypothetical protein BACIT_3202 [Bacillus amyloliquefaciens]|nr:hypothetical protein MY7_2377 [Bacillus sp. 5B6]QEY91043.1 hypothetical protein BACIT_3202 [Bacillus amyloliquefaciens]RAP12314.1 hypothetical protein HS9_03110 [Bacillus velezensis]RAP20164.1 hypothetical protein C2W63_01895 [Bacillus velezensis]